MRKRDSWLGRREAEEDREGFWHPEERDDEPTSRRGPGITRESLGKREPRMRPLRARKDRGRGGSASLTALPVLHLHPLTAQQLDAGASMLSATPIEPEERSRTDDERVEQHTHLARLFGGAALPLTLLAQRTGTATADAGCIHQAQTPIGFWASLVRMKRLPCWATQRPIWLEGKVSTREPTLFPGQSDIWWPISWCGRRKVGHFFVPWRTRRGKLGGAHRIRMQVMTQFQTQVPHPLRNDLPALLTRG